MAKWGQGDPRWIVEERPDATNVNNWHWNEKNATSWSKERFSNLFKNFEIGNNNIKCTITEIEKCTGEASANNRKGKLIFFYEWELLLKWEGRLLNSDSSKQTGKMSIPNLSEENEVDDIEIIISIDNPNDTSDLLKQFMYDIGREKVRQLLGVYITELKEEYSKNLILPIKNGPDKSEKSEFGLDWKTIEKTVPKASSSPVLPCKIDERNISIKEDFLCAASDLYNVLTKQSMVEAFTRGPAKVEANPGGKYELYGGHVQGFFEELVPEKKIKLKWRLKSWPSGHYSEVVIELEQGKSSTQMKLRQSGVPASEYEVIKANWYRYYWHSIKQTFGFGASLGDLF